MRDLWDLRICGCQSGDVDSGSDGDLVFFSQSSTRDDSSSISSRYTVAQSWDTTRGRDWPMPRLVDSLVMCYLGCVLLRIPTTVGDLFGWASSERMPYATAVSGTQPGGARGANL